MIGIQETKKEVIDKDLIKNLWGLGDVDFVLSGSNGQSGGTLLLWSTSKFSREGDIIGNHYSGVNGHYIYMGRNMNDIKRFYGPNSRI